MTLVGSKEVFIGRFLPAMEEARSSCGLEFKKVSDAVEVVVGFAALWAAVFLKLLENENIIVFCFSQISFYEHHLV